MKLFYYIKNLLLTIAPRAYFACNKNKLEKKFQGQTELVQERVDYYCKVNTPSELDSSKSTSLSRFSHKGQSAYTYDLKEFLRYFPGTNPFCYYFGDEVAVEDCPTLYKARPIEGNNDNSVLFKLNKRRHFQFVNDALDFHDKKDMAVFRGFVKRVHRIRFMEAMFENPMMDAGQSNPSQEHPEWQKDFMSIQEQLKYKFIICLEGNDVATNLKWAMSSNSVVVTPKMRFETWFMEGTLQPGVHYVEVKDDWSDFDEKINYYLENPDKAEAMIENAHRHVAQFQDEQLESLICIKTLEKYFKLCQ
ncbi:glycosyltransferase [Vibrio sp. B172a]|uniref:glycosyl transferase family 90 n=1 Tax=Vibrio sp. B172a TaxID=2835790 RepID=UPI002554EA73|nr:glycosyl transferase family 90 [Vibrio sp. B172a]MDK9782495.1 glycosyltransferase [Vibrio sp. B172a]